jgi:DNA transformation protein
MPDASFKDFVLDQLRDVPSLECRRMFGAFGLYSGQRFFAIICNGELYFKTTPATLANYAARGSRPFQPTPKQTLKTYYEVPAEILEDRQRLTEWATDALGPPEVKRRSKRVRHGR